ncbi:TetR/AcrR family transcriptional regulator [Corynebacterium sp. 13CS0277]|uniref:TetR/AcrR family transcriptional regulator n=1 Tax=Corynebacterium sp. 13CS0277 TaxID=2071994 RepID=UPI000D039C71|nr:TetR/AcrR family transcriptional regulator [Corynebacterium sp. 13CS0277]PRQ11273.1 TetR/AcrR family transcriptional regulator [Corynebacterium sp. 13CS0277]
MTSTTPQPSTRERILEQARLLFSSRSYADVSVKDIAVAAGVSPSLVMKHGISKERIFEDTLDFSASGETMFGGPFPEVGRAAVAETLSAPIDAPYSMVRILCVAGGSDATLAAMGERIKRDITGRLCARIAAEAPHPHPAPEQRAQAAVGLLIGLSFMRRVGDPDFATHPTEVVEDYYATLVQSVIDGY